MQTSELNSIQQKSIPNRKRNIFLYTLLPLALITTVFSTTLGVALCNKGGDSTPAPFVEKTIPIEFYNTNGAVINGWKQEVLDNPSVLEGYNTMKFDSSYTNIGTDAFWSSSDTVKNKINACFSNIVKIDIANITGGQHSFVGTKLMHVTKLELSGATLGYQFFSFCDLSGLTQLELPGVTFDQYTFHNSNLSSLKNITFSSNTPPNTNCFTDSTYNIDASNKMIIDVTASTDDTQKGLWGAWALYIFKEGKYKINFAE